MPILTTSQIEDVFYFIDDYVIKHNIACEALSNHFASGTNSFVNFILAVEMHFTWFDYTQSKYILEILDIFLQKAYDAMHNEA